MGFHVLTGARILNTLSEGGLCTTVFSVIITVVSIICSIPRTLNHVSLMSWVRILRLPVFTSTGLIFDDRDPPSAWPSPSCSA